jgi:hypothetical protein
MSNKVLYPVWAVIFAICAGFGFVPEPAGAAKVCCTLLSLLFFVPPAVIVYLGWKERDFSAIRLVRNLALGSLAATLVVLVVNFMTLAVPYWVGDLVYAVLVIVSAPMICSGYWVLSLFLWACLLMASLKKTK